MNRETSATLGAGLEQPEVPEGQFPEHYGDALRVVADRWRADGLPEPQVAVVAGSGLSVALGRPLADPIPFADLLPFKAEAIEGHRLSAELLKVDDGPVTLYYRGRLHAYQGFSAPQVVFPVRLAAELGARTLILSNASGCIDPDASPGDLFLLRDHLNLTGRNPLAGSPPAHWGPRFPDMGSTYPESLRARARQVASEIGVELHDGVYAGLLGPSYETPAEIRMLRAMGADLVGMSTVLEAIAARHRGMSVLGVSLATNHAAGVVPEVLAHADVLEVGKRAAGQVAALLGGLLASELSPR